jgi:TPR repeat
MAPYCLEVPIPKTERAIRPFPADGRLMSDCGDESFPCHPLGPDHFVVEDRQTHLYFETGRDGAKQVISPSLLVQTGREYVDQGRFDAGIAVLEKAVRYYPENPRVHQALAEGHYRQAR